MNNTKSFFYRIFTFLVHFTAILMLFVLLFGFVIISIDLINDVKDKDTNEEISLCSREYDTFLSSYFMLPSLVIQYNSDTYLSSVSDFMCYTDGTSNSSTSGVYLPVIQYYTSTGSTYRIPFNFTGIVTNTSRPYAEFHNTSVLPISFSTGNVSIPYANERFNVSIFLFNSIDNYDFNKVIAEATSLERYSYASYNDDLGMYNYRIRYTYSKGNEILCNMYFVSEDINITFTPNSLRCVFNPLYYIDTNAVYDLGYDTGYDDAYSYAYDLGYDAGALGDSPLEAIANGANSLLSIEIFDGFKISDLFLIAMTVILFGVLMKVFRF